jgi:hypothetical protein
MNAEAMSKIVFLSHTEEEERRRGVPSAAEIRRRAFEICIERVGIGCCDLHDWLQAERELRGKNTKRLQLEQKGSEVRI